MGKDDERPGIICPANIVRGTDHELCSAVVTYAVTGSDNCSGVTTIHISGGTKGTTTVHWKVTDAGGLNFKLSPNPATTEVQVWVSGLSENGGELTVLDVQGRVVWQQSVSAEQPTVTLNVLKEKFAADLYFVALRSEGKVVAKQLMVSKL